MLNPSRKPHSLLSPDISAQDGYPVTQCVIAQHLACHILAQQTTCLSSQGLLVSHTLAEPCYSTLHGCICRTLSCGSKPLISPVHILQKWTYSLSTGCVCHRVGFVPPMHFFLGGGGQRKIPLHKFGMKTTGYKSQAFLYFAPSWEQ